MFVFLTNFYNFQPEFNTVRYSIADEGSREFFEINDVTGNVTLRRSVNDAISTLYKVILFSRSIYVFIFWIYFLIIVTSCAGLGSGV